MRKKLYSLLLPLFFIFSVSSQTITHGDYTIIGQVIDSLRNETVPYVTLRMYASGNREKTVNALASDLDGNFEAKLTSAGSYVLRFESVGKIPLEKTCTVTDNNKKIDLGIIYMNDDLQRLDEVTIVAQKPLVRVEIDKLTYSMEDDPEALSSSTLDMMRKVPMVTVDGEDNIQLKGSSNYKIYLNGKPSNMLSGNNASDVLKSMPASSVKNIEVITDPGVKYDAEGVGGIINIITTKNSLQGYNATVRAGVSALGRYNGGGNISTKIGKFGLTGNYNYSSYRSPWADSEYFRRNLDDTGLTVSQDGRSKNNSDHQYGSVELSYEIDTLNLLSIGGNIWRGNYSSRNDLDVNALDNMTDPLYRYRQESYSKGKYGSVDANIDYQRSTRKKDELLTVSYRFSHSPNDSKTDLDIIELISYPGYKRSSDNDAYTNEHTAQVDYTTPLRNNQTLEAGGKYILRQNISNSDERILPDGSADWTTIDRTDNDFKHEQHIYAAYLGYALKYKKFGFKAGARAEGTALWATFHNDRSRDFSTDFFDFVPNATVSYQINMTQTLRLGYNLRIYRPGIWYLNPYVNDTDPQYISYGNPDLDSEKSHGLNLNYSMFTPKFNLNASLSYRFVNHSIESYSFINPQENGRVETTYANIGHNQNTNLFIYMRYAPVPLLNFFMNSGINYINISTGNMENSILNKVKKDGFSGNVFAGAQVNLPKDFRIDLNGGFILLIYNSLRKALRNLSIVSG